MRQGNFIEVSAPVKGWINENYTKPCNAPPEAFDLAPKPTPPSSGSDRTSLSQPTPSTAFAKPQQPIAQIYEGSWSSDVINGLQMVAERVEKNDGIVRVYVSVKNHTSKDLNLSFFFNGFYAFDNLGNPYQTRETRWSDVIPASSTTQGYITLDPAMDLSASTVTITFGNTGQGPGDPGGGKLSVSEIRVK
jgi:hypothetical protein